MVAFFQAAHVGPDIDHYACALMAQNAGKNALGVSPGQGVKVSVANAGRLDFDQHLARFRSFQLYRFDGQRLAGLKGNGRAYVHVHSPCIVV